jgi:hypothetical protein
VGPILKIFGNHHVVANLAIWPSRYITVACQIWQHIHCGCPYGVSPFSGDDVDCCAGFVSAQEVRASESSEAKNERDFFVRGTTEGT